MPPGVTRWLEHRCLPCDDASYLTGGAAYGLEDGQVSAASGRARRQGNCEGGERLAAKQKGQGQGDVVLVAEADHIARRLGQQHVVFGTYLSFQARHARGCTPRP